MELTKNEKEVLKMLVKHGRISDVSIAKQLNITTQAVGKIRKRLEHKKIIKTYSPILDYDKIGIKVFALALLKIHWSLLANKSEEEIKEEMLKSSAHIIEVYSVQKNDVTHIVLYGFKDLTEVDRFFNRMQIDYKEIEIKDMYIFSIESIIKIGPPIDLFLKLIGEIPTKKEESKEQSTKKAKMVDIEELVNGTK